MYIQCIWENLDLHAYIVDKNYSIAASKKVMFFHLHLSVAGF